ncbi:hypothetical protein SAMN05421720_10323 [Rhodospira trueperi]|uniref:Uncharacterized protein n=1 Tax=Rhodospira trueperi TaxID=69960 RepID=A0A1G6ZTH8_9PROT|nr:hypothetical protein SAMN05421720_10323 [Rhodospira trueperi]
MLRLETRDGHVPDVTRGTAGSADAAFNPSWHRLCAPDVAVRRSEGAL